MIMRALATDLPIIFENVTVTSDTVSILDRINLAFHSGSPSVLIGPNGAGKTTLLHVAMGLIMPSAGRVTWGGQQQAFSPQRRAIVLQRPVMLRRSVEANIRYALRTNATPRRDHIAHRVEELLSIVGLAHLKGRPARKLSAGEQHRLALARALARDPTVLFLDEPTANLDPAATRMIEDIICYVSRQGIKVILSTHDLGEARRLAGDVIFLHRGQIVEAREAAAFFENPATDMARRFLAGVLLPEHQTEED